jgi:hypothetical protein
MDADLSAIESAVLMIIYSHFIAIIYLFNSFKNEGLADPALIYNCPDVRCACINHSRPNWILFLLICFHILAS